MLIDLLHVDAVKGNLDVTGSSHVLNVRRHSDHVNMLEMETLVVYRTARKLRRLSERLRETAPHHRGRILVAMVNR
jgi:hypothetical protein